MGNENMIIDKLNVRISTLSESNNQLTLDNNEKEQEILTINKVSNLYAFISQINQDIVRVKNEEVLFRNACRIALKFGKFKMAWIGLFDADMNEISLVAESGIPSDVIPSFLKAQLNLNGPQGRVLQTGSYHIENDVANSFDLIYWKPFALKYNINSYIVLPIKKAGKTIGTLNLYSAELEFSVKDEISLLDEVARDICFALDMFEKEKLYQYTQELIIDNEKRFRTLIEKSTDMIALANSAGELIYGSPSISTVLGYSTDELLLMPIFNIVHPADLPEFIKNRNKILQQPEGTFNYLQRRRHKNGNWIWCEGSLTNMLHEPGIYAMVSNFRDVTDNIITKQQQEFDRHNLNALINNTNDLMWSVNRQFKLITSNKPFDTMLLKISGNKVSKGDQVLSGVFSPEQSAQHKKFYERAFAGESFREIQHNFFYNELWSEISYYPIRKDDNVIGTACYSRDITASKLAIQELRKSEAFNTGILNSLNSNIAVINENGDLVAVNESWKQFSFENGEADSVHTCVGSNYFDVCDRSAGYGENVAKLALKGIKEVMSEKKSSFYMEYPCHSPSQQQWFGMRAIKFESDDELVVISHQNISERKLAEKNLLQSEARLKEAQAIAHIGNFEIDMLNFTEKWSDEIYSIYGINKKDNLPSLELFLSFVHRDDLQSVKEEFDRFMKTHINNSVEYRFIRQDGGLRYGCTEARFEFDKGQKPVRLYGVLQDITERKLHEIERAEIVSDLILRNKDLEQFAYIISHNLRAPVANIIGASSALNDPELDADDKEILGKGISKSIMKLDEVVKDLNVILEVKSEKDQTRQKVIFSELVDDIRVSITNMTDAEIEVSYDFSAIDAFVTLKAYLYSIFYNLISNSVKYRRQNIHTVIKIKSRLENNKLELTFNDNGMGIDLPKNGENVFGLYKRFHPGLEGKGMGLFMVKTQVENLGGKISIASIPDKGTTFTITFNL